MIDTALIRAKILEQAVLGELSKEFSSSEDSLTELKKYKGRDIREAEGEVPYELKQGWHWFMLSDLGTDDRYSFADGPFGSNLKKEHYTDKNEVRIIQLSNVGELGWKNDNVKYTTFEHLTAIQRSEVKAGNIVIAKMMPAGRAIIVPDVNEKYVLSSDCVKFVPCELLNTKFICYAINSSMFRKQVLQDVHGIGRERTSLSKLKSYLLPIPSKEEQDYIVKKIDMAYEQLALLDVLQTQYLADLEVLKSKIIDAGIQGKLTEQLLEDGTAEELLKQIAEEKKQLVKEKKIKPTKALPEITEDEIPFNIPPNWKFVRLGEVLNEIIVPQRDKPKVFDGDIPWCRIEDAEGIYLRRSLSNQNVSQATVDEMNLRVCPKGTILSACSGASIGRILITESELCTNQTFNGLVCSSGLYNKYLFYYMNHMIDKLRKMGTGAAMAYISQDKTAKMVIPFPPYNEQVRIVDKIDRIMDLI